MFAFQHQREFIYSAFSRWISLRIGSEGLQNALFIYFQGKANGLGGSYSGNEKSDGQRDDGRFFFFFSAAHFKSAWPRRLCRCLISWNYTQALQCFIQQNFTEYKCTNTRTEIWFTSVYNFFSYCSTLHSFVVNIHGPLIYFTVKWICITWHHSIYRINGSLFGSA